MKYIVYAVNDGRNPTMLGLADTDEEVKETLTEAIRKAPGVNIQVGMIH